MYKSSRTISAVLGLFFSAAILSAATVDTLTLTPAGSNTNFLITGTFGADAPTTPYSAPNVPYQLSFSVPTEPSTFLVLDSDDEVFILSTVATLNGVDFPDSSAAFFLDADEGGVQVCLSNVCNVEGIVHYATFDLLGEQLFTGPYTNPVFISGAAVVDSSQSDVYFETPEPGSIALVGLGIGLIVSVRSRRRCKMRATPVP